MAHSEQKIAATLAVLKANGGNVLRTSRETGVGESTIRNWRDKASTNGERQDAIEQQAEATADALCDVFETFIRSVFDVGVTEEKLKDNPSSS